jgi:hypothetical protein
MEPLSSKYFDLFQYVPLRTFNDDDEFVEAEEFCEVLRTRLTKQELHPDEIEYLEVLDLLLTDYAEQTDTDLEDEADEAFEPVVAEEVGDCDAIVNELEDLLVDKRQQLQEWDFIQLCNNLSMVISKKLSELEDADRS